MKRFVVLYAFSLFCFAELCTQGASARGSSVSTWVLQRMQFTYSQNALLYTECDAQGLSPLGTVHC